MSYLVQAAITLDAKYELVAKRLERVLDVTAEELRYLVYYYYQKCPKIAYAELPATEGERLRGPVTSIKAVQEDFEAKVVGLARKIGSAIGEGVAEGAIKATKDNVIPSVLRGWGGSVPPGAAAGGAGDKKGSLVATTPGHGVDWKAPYTEISMEDAMGGTDAERARQRIQQLQAQLEVLNTFSTADVKDGADPFIVGIDLNRRFYWQTRKMKTGVLFIGGHVGLAAWNLVEAEKSRRQSEIVGVLGWVAGAAAPVWQLKKSPAFTNIFPLKVYTPERFSLTFMKVTLCVVMALAYIREWSILPIDNETMPFAHEKRFLEQVIISIATSCALTWVTLRLLERGYENHLAKEEVRLAQKKAGLQEEIELLERVAKKTT